MATSFKSALVGTKLQVAAPARRVGRSRMEVVAMATKKVTAAVICTQSHLVCLVALSLSGVPPSFPARFVHLRAGELLRRELEQG